MRRVVLDTNVLVSALWSKQGNPYKIVEMIFANKVTPYLNGEIIEEYCEVLFRDKLRLPKDKVFSLLQEITKNSIFVQNKELANLKINIEHKTKFCAESVLSKVLFTDESDRKFYDTAKSNEAILITGNKKHFPDESFILSPFEFLQKQ